MKKDGRTITFQATKPMNVESWTVDNQSVMIINDELFVNYRGYGPLKPGDEIMVSNGSVSVGGQPAVEHIGTVRITSSP